MFNLLLPSLRDGFLVLPNLFQGSIAATQSLKLTLKLLDGLVKVCAGIV